MAKFHINPESGDPGECSATQGRCPYGSVDEHYGSASEARSAYEGLMENKSAVSRAKRTLSRDVFVSVLTTSQEVLTENFAGEIHNGLEPGEYAASYYDEKTETDRYVKLKVASNGEVEYERLSKFRSISSPSSVRTQAAVSELRTDLNGLVGKSDPSYCNRNEIDRITLLETSNEIRRMLAKYEWDQAEGASLGKGAFEDLEWVIDHDLDLAREQEKTQEVNALSESKKLVSSFITELNNRRG